MEIKIEKLVDIVNEYLYEESEYRRCVQSLPYKWIASNTIEDQRRYERHCAKTDIAYNAVVSVCEMLDIDFGALLAVVKSVNRHEKHINWESCVHYYCGVDDRVIRFLENYDSAEACYYKSTGNRKKCAM